MKSYKIYSNIMLLAVICFAAASCDLFPQESRILDDDPQIGFENFSRVVDEGSGTVTATVQLIAEQRDTPLDVNFTVVGDASDATSDDYTITTPSPVTIPAGESETTITVEVDGDRLADGESVQVVLELQESDGVIPAENFKQFAIIIEGVDETPAP